MSGLQDGYSGTIYAGYQYLGLGTIVQQVSPQSDVNLSYIRHDSLIGSDAGDEYTGLDRFGRIVDQNWVKLDSPSTPVQRLQYGYDADSNVLYRDDLVNSAYSQVYTYDNLNRLTGFTQGTINSTRTAITGTPTDSGMYTMDAVGNMTTYGSGTRTVNVDNELASGTFTPVYDPAGNLTSGLPVVSGGTTVNTMLVYDAWNELVAVKNASGVAWETFGYDALGRRYVNSLQISPNTTTTSVFSTSGQVLEDDTGSGSTATHETYVWGPDYVNDLVAEDQGTGSTPLNAQHAYAQHDANYDVVSLFGYTGSLRDAYVYGPYGKMTPIAGGTSGDQNFLYQGGRYDSLTQTYQFDARVYAPRSGRGCRGIRRGM